MRVTEVSIVAIRPICVCIPVAVTTIVPVPRVTEVLWNSMLVWSPRPTSAEASGLASLAIGALSPVSAASCASRVADRTIRPSAGTMSPASTWTMSPGTTCVAAIIVTSPSRTTRACGTCRSARALTLARAVSSWRVPSPTFSRMSNATMIPVESSPITRLTITTAISMMFIGSRSCCSAMAQAEGGFSAAISFAPYVESRLAASLPASPEAGIGAGCGDDLVRREHVRRTLCVGRCHPGLTHLCLLSVTAYCQQAPRLPCPESGAWW